MARKINKEEIIKNIPYVNSEYDLLLFAKELRSLFPKGYMGDRITPWRSSSKDMVNKLLRFHSEYGYEYTKEQILDATKKYIAKFHSYNNYMGMRCSKHFIRKELDNGDTVSELATMLEQMEDGDASITSMEDNWTTELR